MGTGLFKFTYYSYFFFILNISVKYLFGVHFFPTTTILHGLINFQLFWPPVLFILYLLSFIFSSQIYNFTLFSGMSQIHGSISFFRLSINYVKFSIFLTIEYIEISIPAYQFENGGSTFFQCNTFETVTFFLCNKAH